MTRPIHPAIWPDDENARLRQWLEEATSFWVEVKPGVGVQIYQHLSGDTVGRWVAESAQGGRFLNLEGEWRLHPFLFTSHESARRAVWRAREAHRD